MERSVLSYFKAALAVAALSLTVHTAAELSGVGESAVGPRLAFAGNVSSGGACCADATCIDVFSQSECGNYAGSYLGDGTNCESDGYLCFPVTTSTIPTPTGACCVDDAPATGTRGVFAIDCYEVDAETCTFEFGGSYQGDFTSCETFGICGFESTTTTFPDTTTTTSTTTSTTSTTLPPAVCGDGFVEEPEECDDANTADGDGCSSDCEIEECWACFNPGEGPSECTASMDDTPCDDGELCTVGDVCTGGVCEGTTVLIPAACEWVMVGGDPTRSVQSRTRGSTVVVGDVCGDTVRFGLTSSTTGDTVATASSGRGAFFGPSAIVDGDIVTGGSSVFGKPRGTLLPGLLVSELAGGSTDAQSGNPDNTYDTTGTSPRVADCDAAQAGIDTAAVALDALTGTQSLGDVNIKGNASLTINATVPGGLNVVDLSRLRTGNKATITLDGGGDEDTVFVLRVDRKLFVRFQSQIVLANGASAERVILYGRNKCKFGIEVVGAGTVICPDGKLLLSERIDWTGSLLGGRKLVQLKDSGVLTHAPLLVGP